MALINCARFTRLEKVFKTLCMTRDLKHELKLFQLINSYLKLLLPISSSAQR